jgi:hypothetical protein
MAAERPASWNVDRTFGYDVQPAVSVLTVKRVRSYQAATPRRPRRQLSQANIDVHRRVLAREEERESEVTFLTPMGSNAHDDTTTPTARSQTSKAFLAVPDSARSDPGVRSSPQQQPRPPGHSSERGPSRNDIRFRTITAFPPPLPIPLAEQTIIIPTFPIGPIGPVVSPPPDDSSHPGPKISSPTTTGSATTLSPPSLKQAVFVISPIDSTRSDPGVRSDTRRVRFSFHPKSDRSSRRPSHLPRRPNPIVVSPPSLPHVTSRSKRATFPSVQLGLVRS